MVSTPNHPQPPGQCSVLGKGIASELLRLLIAGAGIRSGALILAAVAIAAGAACLQG
jgi:hypothetical protein